MESIYEACERELVTSFKRYGINPVFSTAPGSLQAEGDTAIDASVTWNSRGNPLNESISECRRRLGFADRWRHLVVQFDSIVGL